MPNSYEKIRSIRVDGLPRTLRPSYLYNCFNDNAEVLAATITGYQEDHGFVEFDSHSSAELVLKSYNGALMPNFNNERFQLSWDTNGYGTRWRWDIHYEICSFFGYNEDEQLTARMVRELYKDLKPVMKLPPTQAPFQQLETVAPTLGQVPMEIDKEKELYLCFHESTTIRGSGYVFRTIKLSELLACSCQYIYSPETGTINVCAHCATKPKHLRQRSWLFASTGKNVPASWGGEETEIPKFMRCCAIGSRIFFTGGLLAPPPNTGRMLQPTKNVYSFALESTSWEKHDWSFQMLKQRPVVFELNGNLYCLTGKSTSWHLKRPTFEVYNFSSGEPESLPDPPFYAEELELEGPYYIGSFPDQMLGYAIVGTKFLVSSRIRVRDTHPFPIMCFDVKEKIWTEMPSLFNGEPFPFNGRALVLDLNDGTPDKVMFSFRKDFNDIFLSRLQVKDDGNISVSRDEHLRFAALFCDLISDTWSKTFSFVDLGNQKVAFVICGNVEPTLQKLRVVVAVIQYEWLKQEGCFQKEITAARTFECDCHASSIMFTELIGSFVF